MEAEEGVVEAVVVVVVVEEEEEEEEVEVTPWTATALAGFA